MPAVEHPKLLLSSLSNLQLFEEGFGERDGYDLVLGTRDGEDLLAQIRVEERVFGGVRG